MKSLDMYILLMFDPDLSSGYPYISCTNVPFFALITITN